MECRGTATGVGISAVIENACWLLKTIRTQTLYLSINNLVILLLIFQNQNFIYADTKSHSDLTYIHKIRLTKYTYNFKGQTIHTIILVNLLYKALFRSHQS